MIGRKITSVFIAVIAGIIFCGVAAFANLEGFKVTPTDATANSIFTFEMTWKDSDNKYPVGEKDTLDGLQIESDLDKVKFRTIWPLLPGPTKGVASVYNPADPDTDLFDHESVVTGPDDQGYYHAMLAEALEEWPEGGLKVLLYYPGYRVAEPIECQRPSKPTSDDPYRTGREAWLGRTRSSGGYGQVPVVRGGFLGVFTTPNPTYAELQNDLSDRSNYDRHLGKIGLSDSCQYEEVYWALYMIGPVTLEVAGQTLHMAEKDEGSQPASPNGVTYYVRCSAGLDLANRSDYVPGVNYHGGLVYPGDPVNPYHVVVRAYQLPQGNEDPSVEEHPFDPVRVRDTHRTMPGYVNEHDLLDATGRQVATPYRISIVDGVYALKVDHENNGYVKADWQTNYFTGGNVSNGPGGATITLGTACIKTERIFLTDIGGKTSIRLPLGYAYIIQSPAHFFGVFLEKGASTNYFSSYDPGDLWSNTAPEITLNAPLPANQHYVWIQYAPRVMVQCVPSQVMKLASTGGRLPTDPGAFSLGPEGVRDRFGSQGGTDTTLLASHMGVYTPLDPLNVELPTTAAGMLPVTDPKDPTQTQKVIMRGNPLDLDNPVILPESKNHPDDGTSSSVYSFKIAFFQNSGLRPWAWMPQDVSPLDGPPYRDDLHTGGVVLYLDEKGYGDYKPYFMAKFNPTDYTYRSTVEEGGCWYIFRVEPANGWAADYEGPTAIPMPFSQGNLYRSLACGQYHYFFAACADYIRDEEGNLWENPRVWVSSDPLPSSGEEYDFWTDPKPYNPLISGFDNRASSYSYADRPGYSPGDTDAYGRDPNGKGQLNSSEHPIVHPQLEPPMNLSVLVNEGRFLGTLTPYYPMFNPAYDYPSHGHTFNGVHNHWGFDEVVKGIWSYSIPSSGSTTATEHTFRIKYTSKDPLTGKGIAPNGVWVYINNASRAGNAGSVTLDEARKNPPADPHVFVRYQMQPAAGDPLDYANGVIYEVRGITLPAGPHSYYFEADDGFGVARYPVRPDGRWQIGTTPSGDGLTAFWEDPFVPGDHDFADNNDICPGPYVNNKPRLADAKVSPNSGSEDTNFRFSVTYYDIDGDVTTLPATNPGRAWGGPIYKGQRPYLAELVIEIDSKTKETRRVGMNPVDRFDVNFMDGCEYECFIKLSPGEHRFYFEFVDDWGHPVDTSIQVPGEKVRFPEGNDTWLVGPVVMANSAPTLSDGTVVSTDGTNNSATLWNFGVTYSDANNEQPTYINMYVGEEMRKKAVLERATPIMDADGNYSIIRVANCSIKQVEGIYSTPIPAPGDPNLFETNHGSIHADLNGEIRLGTPLPKDGNDNTPDVYVTYYYDTLVWSKGYEMTKANPADVVYSDGVRYEVNLRLGGANKQMLEPGKATIIPESNGLAIQVDPNIVKSIIGIYDNEDLLGINYWTGEVVNDLYTSSDLVNYNPNTYTAKLTLRHKPIAADSVIGVYANPRGTGTNYLDPSSVDRANGVIGLRAIPPKQGSTTEPSVTEFYVSYSTPVARYDAQTGVITLSTPIQMASPEDTPFVFVSYQPRAYYFAYEASDSQNVAVYNTAIDPVTLADSRWAGAIYNREYAKKETLETIEAGRQYAPKFEGYNTTSVETGQVLVGGLPNEQATTDKEILSDPVLYRSEEKLIQQYEGIAKLASTGSDEEAASGRAIQLQRLTVTERAWKIDGTHIQLRRGPIPDPNVGGNPILSVVDIRDGLTQYYGGGAVNWRTGIVDMVGDPTDPPTPIPDVETKVTATYQIWGISDYTTGKINGVDDVLAIYDNEQLTGFDYWSGIAQVEPAVVERQLGGETLARVAHTPVWIVNGNMQVEGVWDNPSTTGNNYLDVNYYDNKPDPDAARQDDANSGIIRLKGVPSTVNQVYISYRTEPATYDRGTGKISLVSPLPAGKRSVWIKYRHHADYRVNLLGNDSNNIVPSFTFDYNMPGNQSDPATAVKADYWFGRRTGESLGYNTPPKLTNGRLTPISGTSTMGYTFLVDYTDNDGPNGQPPSYVRVIIDGNPYDMKPVVSGTPVYSAGATFRYSTTLTTGAHKYHFEASDGEGFAFLGYYGSTPTRIVDIPGPWVNDNPTLTDGTASPNPTDTALDMLEPVDFLVTYTDRDNEAPDPNNPWCWIDYGKTVRPDEVVAPHYGVVDDIIREDGTSVNDNSDSQAKARKIYFNFDAHKADSDPLVAKEAQTRWYVDQFAGKYLQILSGPSKGRVYQIAYNNTDTITVTDEDIISDSIETGTRFIIGPVGMSKANPSETDHTRGIVYKVTIPRMTPSESGHTYHFETTATAWIPKLIGDSFKPPLTEEQRKIVQSARFPTPTGELQLSKVTVNVPTGDKAPELFIPDDGKFLDAPNPPVAGGAYTFYVKYRDVDGDAPSWRKDAPVLGYIRVVFDDGSFAEDMLPVAGQTGTYATGMNFAVTSNKVAGGTHKFHFEASDGWKTVRLDDPRFTITINDRPQIIVGLDDLTPPAGNSGTQFEFSAIIKDSDGWPNGAWVKLTIRDPQDHTKKVEVNGNQMTKSGNDYINTGVLYKWTMKPSDYPAVFDKSESYTYEYVWEANDGTDAAIPVVKAGPVINPNLAVPQLSLLVDTEGKPMPVDPMSGNLSQNYTFQVMYYDSDGDAPVVASTSGTTEGVILIIDGKTSVVLKPARDKGVQPNYKAGEKYVYTMQGRYLPDIKPGVKDGTHTLEFRATDDLTPGSTHQVTLTAQGPTIEQSSIVLVPDVADGKYTVGAAATISGRITPSIAQSPVTVIVKRPDGSGLQETIQTDSDGTFQFKFTAIPNPDLLDQRPSRTLDTTGRWTITAKWNGTPATGPASTNLNITVSCPSPYDRYVLATDASGNPLKDMISSPLYYPGTGVNVGYLWESDKIYQTDISRYDPETGLWLSREILAPFTGGEAFRLIVISPESFPRDENNQMSLSPFGKLWYQDSKFTINLKAGWNQIGSVFLRPINWGDCRVLYNDKEMSLSEANAAGIIKDYAWKWDARQGEYRLVHAQKSGALRVLEPYGGYWVSASVDCTLILVPGARSRGASTPAVKDSSEPLPNAGTNGDLEMPPAP